MNKILSDLKDKLVTTCESVFWNMILLKVKKELQDKLDNPSYWAKKYLEYIERIKITKQENV